MIALVVALPGVTLWTLASRSYFAYEDFWQFVVTLHEGLTVHFLFLPAFQHFGPGGHFIFWIVVRFFPMQFGPALGIVMLFYFGSVLVFQGILDTLFGRRWATLAVTFLFATSLFWVESVDWFGCGVQRPSATLFTLLALYFYLRFAYSDRARWLVLSNVAYCAALAFFIQPILLPFYLVALRLFFLGSKSDYHILTAFRILWREARVWHGYAIESLLYLVYYFHRYYYSSGPRPKAVDVLDFLQLAWVRTLIPGLLGFRPVQTLSGIGLSKVLLANAIFVLLVVASFRYRPSAWRGWTFGVGSFLFVIWLSGGQRVGEFGIGVAYSQRYFLDPSWLLLLGGALALLPYRQAYGTRSEPKPRRPLPPAAPLVAIVAIVVVALTAHAALAWNSANEIINVWQGTANKVYFSHLTADLDTLKRRGQVLNLADVAVPESMVGSWIAPYNYASNVFATMPQPLVYDDFSQPLWVPDDTGRLHRAFFTGVAGGLVGALKDAHVLRTSSAFSGKERLCGVAGHRARLTLTVGPIPGHRYYFQIQTTGKATIRATTTTSLGTRNPPGPMLVVTQPGFSTQALDAASPMRLALDIRPTSRFCVASIVVGTFIAEGPTVGD
jgi:hypothetical protein